jgi:predicted ribosome quality control (RQC) complex YloA/Tae2 family protein
MRAGLSSNDRAEVVREERTRRLEALEASLARARRRLSRRIDALVGDLQRIAEADAVALRAQIFTAAAASAPRGTTTLRAVDWSSGNAVEVTLQVDPATPAREQLGAMFRRARRLRNGAAIARGRLSDAREALARLDALAGKLATDPDTDLTALAAEARTIAPRDFVPPAPPSTRNRDTAEAAPYRTFLGASGIPIWVGRDASQNDALSLHVAKPYHLWLHAKGYAGAHVVVPLKRGASCPAELLVEAAHLAAHFSKARDERVVEVSYTPRRYVRKPRGSSPGQVLLSQEKTLVLRRSEATLRRLLDRELAR